ncbi:MAG: hypothetical protein LBV04_03135, partial [Deferribacteraceae bacterium]|nr:hypothetical protein [Deferribacteraceae bacterium]
SAFAVEVSVDGYHEFVGRTYSNTNLGDGTTGNEAVGGSVFTQELRLWARLKLYEGAQIVIRMRPTDGGTRVLGGNSGLYDQANRDLMDLAWIDYQLNDTFNVKLGRVWGNGYYISNWGVLHDGHGYADNPDPRDGGIITAKFSDTASVFALVGKKTEGATDGANRAGGFWKPGASSDPREDNDNDLYVLGADLKFGIVRLMPSVGFLKDTSNAPLYAGRDNSTVINGGTPTLSPAIPAIKNPYNPQRITGYLGASITPSSALNAKVAFAIENYDNGVDKFSAIGAYGEVNVKPTDTVSVGAQVAYSGNDEGYAMGNGDSFGWTYLLTDKLTANSGQGGLMAELYTDVKLGEKMTLRAVAGYFQSMTDDNYTGNAYAYKYEPVDKTTTALTATGTRDGMNEDATGMEFDLSLAYAMKDINTTFTVGGAFASLSDWGTKGYDPDPVYAAYWKIRTNF